MVTVDTLSLAKAGSKPGDVENPFLMQEGTHCFSRPHAENQEIKCTQTRVCRSMRMNRAEEQLGGRERKISGGETEATLWREEPLLWDDWHAGTHVARAADSPTLQSLPTALP